jgi:hypothetical protein
MTVVQVERMAVETVVWVVTSQWHEMAIRDVEGCLRSVKD